MEIMKLDKDSICIIKLPENATDENIITLRDSLEKYCKSKFLISFPDVSIEEIPESELNRLGYFKKETKLESEKKDILGSGMCDHCKEMTNEGKYIKGKFTCPDCDIPEEIPPIEVEELGGIC